MESFEYGDFTEELSGLLNKHSKENGSNTPDFVLARFLTNCLTSFNEAIRERAAFFDKKD